MVQLQGDIKKIEDAGIQVVGISYDSVKTLKEFSKQKKISYPLLSDSESKTIDDYKIRNKKVDAGSKLDGIPIPTTFVVDTKGIIRAVLPGTTRKRHSTEELLEAAKKAQ